MTLQDHAVTEAVNPSPTIYLPSYVEDKTYLTRGADLVAIYMDALTAKRAGFKKGDKVSAKFDDQNMQFIVRSDPDFGRTLSQHAPKNGREYDLYVQFPYRTLGPINRLTTTRKTLHKPSIVTSGYITIPVTDDWLPADPVVPVELFEDQASEQAHAIADLIKEIMVTDIEEAILNGYLQGKEDAEKPVALRDVPLHDLLAEVGRRSHGLVE